MTLLNKIDSNITGLRIAEETSIGILPAAASQIWYPYEPNSYSEFGGKIKTVARNPINRSRQRKKGLVTGVEAQGGFVTDLTQTNLQRVLQGFFFASFREKAATLPYNGSAVPLTSVTASSHKYAAASGLSVFRAGDLVLASGFTIGTNNGLRRVTAISATEATVAETLADETPTAAAALQAVGFQFASADASITNTGTAFPTLNTSAKDLTQLGIIPGEWVFIGGDTSSLKFATSANNGFARVRSVTTNTMTFDKTANTMVTDAGTGKTIQLFVGRVLKNEGGTSIVRRTYKLERSLGANNTADLTLEQAEYLKGSVPNELTLNVPTADKATAEVKFHSLDSEYIDENVTGANSLLSKAAVAAGSSANAPALVETDAFNTSSDVSRIKLSSVSATNAAPTPLFAYVTDLTFTISNNLSPNEAVGVTGAFEITSGQFEVGGKMTAYFADIAAVQAVRNNADITLDAHFVKANAGISIDLPLLSLGDGRPTIEADQPIKLPLENAASTGAKVASTLDHTMLMVFWDYLPSLADS